MTTQTIYAGDSLTFTVPVTEGGNVKDISGGTVTASAKRVGKAAVTPTATISDGPAGEVTIEFDAGDLASGFHTFHLRVSLSDGSQLVLESYILVLTANV